VGLHPLQWAAGAALRLLGWTLEIAPLPPRGVVIVYPHTSNWDFVVGYLAKVAGGVRVRWVGKASLFRWPLGALFRRMGGIPVERGARSGVIGALAEEYARHDRLWIALAPEGTRAFTDHWKSGFYHLALAARVPLGLASLDWGRRRIALRTLLEPSGDVAADLARIREAYDGVRGLRPERAGVIRFR
jgi:1-acyl-sn-glycerol-3-phosphate acyltransferase